MQLAAILPAAIQEYYDESTMEEVAGLVEQAFEAGLDTQEGAALLAEAQSEFSGAVDALEEITGLLSRNPEELRSEQPAE